MLRQLCVLATACIAMTAHAHHGLDFLLLQDGTIPKPGSAMLFDNTEWSTFNGEDEWGTEPGIHLGVTPWLAIGTTASIMDEGNGWHYLSTTPYLNVSLFKSERVPWLKVSLYAGYEFPDNVAEIRSNRASTATRSPVPSLRRRSLPSQTSPPNSPKIKSSEHASTSAPRTARHTTGGGSVGGGGPDAPTGGTTHDHPVAQTSGAQDAPSTEPVVATQPQVALPVTEGYLGIHRHGEEGLHARLIVDLDLGVHHKLVANVINFTPAEGTPVWGYAVGYRHAFDHDLAMSLEAIGDFDGRGSHEALVAAHYTINHHFTIKLGVGMGLTEASPDASIHAGMVWRF